MKIKLESKRYIVAVSGGVDSMVLLDLASTQEKPQIIVAHFDHGIHKKSRDFCDFVAKEAKKRGLMFVSAQGRLGPGTSEAKAREARYRFLGEVKRHNEAAAILTAHHQDDLVETAIINLIRGTGRKGLASLRSTDEVIRPLLAYSKEEIKKYAQKHSLDWREDPTNTDTSYLRNYLRLEVLPRLTPLQKKRILKLINDQQVNNEETEGIIAKILQDEMVHKDKVGTAAGALWIDRKVFISLPHGISKEIMAELMRSYKLSFNAKIVEKAVVFAKTARKDKKMSIDESTYLVIDGDHIKFNLL